MGFTQRQASGKFTREEADEFIERLQSEVYGDHPPDSSSSIRAGVAIALDEVPAEALAAELQRRGWVVLQPD